MSKHQGKAHVRNRGKRILREAMREILKNYEIYPCKIILLLKNKALGSKTQEIYLELERLIRKLKT